MASTEMVREENKMGVMPIPPLLFSMALPMMVSMLVQALYNVVDSIFVARLSEEALTAVSLAFPMQNLMIGVASGIGVGMNAMLSKKLGEKEFDTANKAAVHGIFLSFLGFIMFFIIGLTLVKPFLTGQLSSGAEQISAGSMQIIFQGGTDYLTVICLLSFGLFGQVIMERMLQSTGLTFYSMITQATGAVLNIILDPILIFGLFGMPRLGIKGAAIATVFGQITATCLAYYFNISKNKEITLRFKGFRPELPMIGRILYVGVPSMVMVAIGSVTTYGMNRILTTFSSTATAVFGAYFKLQSFIMMPVFGLNNGMVPIIAYNYGARKKDRILTTIRLSMITAMAIMLAGLVLLHVIPGPLLMLFSASDNMLKIGIPALKTISWSFVAAGFCIVAGSVFQAFGNGIYSMIVSIMRQLVVLLPSAYLFSLTGNVNMVWWAYPLAEIMSVIVSIVFLYRIYKQIIEPM